MASARHIVNIRVLNVLPGAGITLMGMSVGSDDVGPLTVESAGPALATTRIQRYTSKKSPSTSQVPLQ